MRRVNRAGGSPIVRVLSAMGFGNVLAADIFLPMLPSLQREWNLTASELGAWMSVPALGSLLFGPLSGRLADAMGRRLVIRLGLSIFALGGLLCFLVPYLTFADPYYVILVGRLLQTLGHVTTFPQYLALAGEALPPGQRQAAMGAVESWTSVGGILGPMFGSAMLRLGLYVPFLGTAAVMLAALLLSLSTMGTRGREVPLASSPSRAAEDSHWAVGWHAYLGGFLVMGLMVGLQTFVGSYARDELGAPGYWAGLLTAVIPAAMACSSLAIVVLRGDRRDGGRTLLGAAAAALGGALLWSHSTSAPQATVALVLVGAGLGVWLPLVDHDVSESGSEATRGTRLAILHSSKITGILILPALLGVLIDATGQYRDAFFSLFIVAGALTAISLAGRRRDTALMRNVSVEYERR
jgi:ACDE family multidrug resistance protein